MQTEIHMMSGDFVRTQPYSLLGSFRFHNVLLEKGKHFRA